MISKFLLGGIQYTAKGFKHIKKHKKKTGYGSFIDKTKWL